MRKPGESSTARKCVETEDGRLVQCPRAWRDAMQYGMRYKIQAHMRADGSCLVALKSSPPIAV